MYDKINMSAVENKSHELPQKEIIFLLWERLNSV